MLTHYTRKKLEEERNQKNSNFSQEPVEQENHEYEFSEELTPQFDVQEESEKPSKKSKKK